MEEKVSRLPTIVFEKCGHSTFNEILFFSLIPAGEWANVTTDANLWYRAEKNRILEEDDIIHICYKSVAITI
jgi:hypothetical protein